MPIPKILVSVALVGAQMALSMLRKIEGPRLEDLAVTVADYGTPLNYFYGTRRFNGVPIIEAEPIREQKKKRKTKGGKINEYRYFGTWAVAVADHEIDAVTRIWFDKHLVYDATGVGPITALSKKTSIGDVMRIYLGTETQEPDPRMTAFVEAKNGAGTNPAYRGVAYIVFEEVPLEVFGNRIPQISVEAVANGTTAYPYEELATIDAPLEPVKFSPDRSRMFWTGGTNYEIWDLTSRQRIIRGTWAGSGYGRAISQSGSIYGIRSAAGPDGKILTVRDADGVGVPVDVHTFTTSVGFSDVQIVRSETENAEIAFMLPFSASTDIGWIFLQGTGGYFEEENPAYQISHIFGDLDGNIWGVGAILSSTTLVFKRLFQASGTLPDYFEVTAPSSEGVIAHTQAFHYRDSAVDHFVVRWDSGDYLLAVDLATKAITIQSNVSTPGVDWDMWRVVPGAGTFWLGAHEYSSVTLAEIRFYSDTDLINLWVNDGGTPINTWFDPVGHALVTQPFPDDQWTWRFLDRVSGAGVTLGLIVSDVCERVGMDPADYDTSDLDQIVEGYSWTQGSGKAIIEPLLDAYDSDCRPHNFELEFLKRGTASAGTIEVGEFAVSGGTRYTITKSQDTDLQRRLTFTYADPAGDQQPNSVVVQRPLDNMDGVREASFDMSTLVLSVDEARQLAERYFRRVWNSRETYAHSLTAQRMALEPADVWTLGLDDVRRIARVTKMTLAAADSVGMEWVQDYPSLGDVTITPGAPQDGRVPSVIVVPQLVRALILDIPSIRDADNSTNPLLYYGAGPYGTGLFPGATILQLDGTEYDLEIAGVPSNSQSSWGYATDSLDSASHYVWDRGNSVNVQMNYGTLIAATEADCNANPRLNLVALGAAGRWELLQFTTPTLQGNGSYTLTGLKRGRRGTEWAVGTHAVGDTFILLSTIAATEMGAGDIGDDLSFKAVTLGTDEESAIPTDVDDYSGASNKPWAPDQFEAVKDPSTDDITFTWKRRSRIAGDYAPYDPPLGESVEEYDVKIYRSGFGSPATRTINVSSETAVYEAADQITDGGDLAWEDIEAGVLQVGDLADGYETQVAF